MCREKRSQTANVTVLHAKTEENNSPAVSEIQAGKQPKQPTGRRRREKNLLRHAETPPTPALPFPPPTSSSSTVLWIRQSGSQSCASAVRMDSLMSVCKIMV